STSIRCYVGVAGDLIGRSFGPGKAPALPLSYGGHTTQSMRSDTAVPTIEARIFELSCAHSGQTSMHISNMPGSIATVDALKSRDVLKRVWDGFLTTPSLAVG